MYFLLYGLIYLLNANSVIPIYIHKPLSIYNLKLIKTPILSFLPFLKLHHIVLLFSENKDGLYAIDFSPFYQSDKKTLLKLFLGKNVDAEIRIRFIPNNITINDKSIIDYWYNSNSIRPYDSKNKSMEILLNMCNKKEDCLCKDENMQNIFKNIMNEWRESMNLYNHNCQHFSSFVFAKF